MSKFIAMSDWLGVLAVACADERSWSIRLFDDNWWFQSGEVKQPEAPGCDDNAWRTVMVSAPGLAGGRAEFQTIVSWVKWRQPEHFLARAKMKWRKSFGNCRKVTCPFLGFFL